MGTDTVFGHEDKAAASCRTPSASRLPTPTTSSAVRVPPLGGFETSIHRAVIPLNVVRCTLHVERSQTEDQADQAADTFNFQRTTFNSQRSTESRFCHANAFVHPWPLEARLRGEEFCVIGSYSGSAASSGGLIRVLPPATESQQIFRRPACTTALIRGRRSRVTARQATLVPATPGCETRGFGPVFGFGCLYRSVRLAAKCTSAAVQPIARKSISPLKSCKHLHRATPISRSGPLPANERTSPHRTGLC